MSEENNKSHGFYLCLLGFIIGLSLIISTLTYVNYNRYECVSVGSESIVFDKLTGEKYNPSTFVGKPK